MCLTSVGVLMLMLLVIGSGFRFRDSCGRGEGVGKTCGAVVRRRSNRGECPGVRLDFFLEMCEEREREREG